MRDCRSTILIQRQPEGESLMPGLVLSGCDSRGSALEEAREMAAYAMPGAPAVLVDDAASKATGDWLITA